MVSIQHLQISHLCTLIEYRTVQHNACAKHDAKTNLSLPAHKVSLHKCQCCICLNHQPWQHLPHTHNAMIKLAHTSPLNFAALSLKLSFPSLEKGSVCPPYHCSTQNNNSAISNLIKLCLIRVALSTKKAAKAIIYFEF